MKLFAYEHPSGPVHEVEVTLGDTVQLRRSITVERGCCSPARPAAASMGETRRRSTIARSRGRRARAVAPSLADFRRSRAARARRDDLKTNTRRSSSLSRRSSKPCRLRRGNHMPSTRRCPRHRVGSMAWRFTKAHAIIKSLRDVPTGHTRKSSKRKNSTSPSAARSSTTTPRRSRPSASRRTTRCAPSPSR